METLPYRVSSVSATMTTDDISVFFLSFVEIRIPLIWKETEYFKGKGDYRRFAVFCLLQVGSEIYDTVMVNVDRNVTDICFDDTFNFHKVQPDFQFKLSVYARLIHEDLSMAPTHKKFAQKISSSVSRSLGRRFSHMKDDFDSESYVKWVYDCIFHSFHLHFITGDLNFI